MMLQPTEHAIIFEVEIPESEYLICNFDKWGYRVNYFYVPLDEADEKAHMEELKNMESPPKIHYLQPIKLLPFAQAENYQKLGSNFYDSAG